MQVTDLQVLANASKTKEDDWEHKPYNVTSFILESRAHRAIIFLAAMSRTFTMKPGNHSIFDKLLRLRVAVAFLGEKDQYAWWSTRFLGTAGLRFLEFSYPRSAFAAGVTAANEAAKALHDRRIGKGRAFHLFRLPHTMEERLHALLFSPDVSKLTAIVASKNSAIGSLAEIGKDPKPAPEGPVRLGNEKILLSGATIPKLAAFYADAFQREKQTLPYFTAKE